jgi:hypothetical protein
LIDSIIERIKGMTIDELKNFRQLHQIYPKIRTAPGRSATTGPTKLSSQALPRDQFEAVKEAVDGANH